MLFLKLVLSFGYIFSGMIAVMGLFNFATAFMYGESVRDVVAFTVCIAVFGFICLFIGKALLDIWREEA